jgi:hypothetical protein
MTLLHALTHGNVTQPPRRNGSAALAGTSPICRRFRAFPGAFGTRRSRIYNRGLDSGQQRKVSPLNARAYRILRGAAGLAPLLLTGCGRAPAFDVLGSFFPAWLVCFAVAILLAVLCRALLQPRVEIAFPVLVYPSLTAVFTFALWLALFR